MARDGRDGVGLASGVGVGAGVATGTGRLPDCANVEMQNKRMRINGGTKRISRMKDFFPRKGGKEAPLREKVWRDALHSSGPVQVGPCRAGIF